MPPAVAEPIVSDTDVDDFTIRMAGIGGTGVVTISQILGTAAMLAGYHVRGLDQTGLSQKAGPVVSDLRLSRSRPHASNKATAGSVDVILAFDQLVAGGDATLRTMAAEHTVVVANSAAIPTGSMVVDPTRPYPLAEVGARLDDNSESALRVDAQRLTIGLLGDSGSVNVFMLGVATQAGHVPVGVDYLERAITLNGVAVEKNLAAFSWGRAWVADPAATEAAAGFAPVVDEGPPRERLSADLVGYQSARYAKKFDDVLDKVAAVGSDELTDAVAYSLHKLMAYKDEYEVARLLLQPAAHEQARAVGGERTNVTWMLHPPMLRAMGMKNKLRLGRWATPAFWLLHAMRRLRGTPFDFFGWAKVRRLEREMIPEYIAAIEALLSHVSPSTLPEIIAIALLPDRVRGYEHIKWDRAIAYREELSRRVAAFLAGVGAQDSVTSLQ